MYFYIILLGLLFSSLKLEILLSLRGSLFYFTELKPEQVKNMSASEVYCFTVTFSLFWFSIL